jgi:hypothetical protein
VHIEVTVYCTGIISGRAQAGDAPFPPLCAALRTQYSRTWIGGALLARGIGRLRAASSVPTRAIQQLQRNAEVGGEKPKVCCASALGHCLPICRSHRSSTGVKPVGF